MPSFNKMPTFKPTFQPSVQEFSAPPLPQPSNLPARLIEATRLALTLLTLLCGITILGTTSDTLSVYNTTHLGQDFFLPLWPTAFDIRPTIAMVVCGSLIVIVSGIAIGTSRIPTLKNSLPIVIALPTISLIASLISTSFFYAINTSSTKFSLQSWSCQWKDIAMDSKPHWGTLCRESKVGLYFSVLMIPLSVCVLGISAMGVVVRRKNAREGFSAERKGSPAMS